MSSDSKRIIGTNGVVKDKNTGTYSTSYYLTESELEEYTPNYGDAADWTPVAARITRIDKKDIAPGYYILSLEAEADASVSIFGSSKDITDKFEWKYESRLLYYPPKLWGVRRATAQDVRNGAVNIYIQTANVKDFIFKNYYTDPLHAGSINYDESPYSSTSHPPIAMLGQKRETPHFIVTFWSERSPKYLQRFCGINGRFPTSLEVHNGRVQGKWRLRHQDLSSYIDNNGRNYTKVTRTFGYALGGLWDPKKCIGYWKSWEIGGIKEA